MGQNNERGRFHIEENKFPWPRLRDKDVTRLSKNQLRKNIRHNTEFAVREGSVSSKKLNRFVRSHVRGYRVNGMDVLLIDHEHDRPMEGIRMGELHPAAAAIIASESTYAVGVEYFTPELRRNAQRVPGIGPSYIAASEKRLPLIFAKNLADQTAKARKPLFVVDPANRETVALSHHLLPWAVGLGLIAAIPLFPEVVKNPAILLPALAYLQFHRDVRKIGTDHNRLHPFFQRFGMSVDDSRRLFIAAGIKEVVRKVRETDPNAIGTTQLVLLYPRAHTMAIGDYLLHPHVIKRALYRLRLDVPKETRIFLPDPRTNGKQKGDMFDGWKRIIHQPMPIFR